MPVMPIAAVELQEYLFSETLAKVAIRCSQDDEPGKWDELRKHTREDFRWQRFAVMNWLIMNGVSIPAELLTDQAHPPVGQQYPDRDN